MKTKLLLLSISSLCTALAAPARADFYPPLRASFKMPPLPVLNEAGEPYSLDKKLQSLKLPLFFLPVFTRCGQSCPVLAQNLKKALAAQASKRNGSLPPHQVLLFSFDASDTAEDLLAFRRREALPETWSLARSTDQAAVRLFFDQFSYAIMSAGKGFNHPGEVLVFNGESRWVGSLFGPTLSGTDIEDALKATQPNGIVARAKQAFFHPETLAWIGGFGFLSGTFSLLALVLKRSRSAQQIHG